MSRDKHTTSRRAVVKIGERFGRLVVIDEPFMVDCPTANYPINRVKHVRCKCDCGAIVVYRFASLRTGNTSSCGCLRREMVAAKNHKHGMRKRVGGSPPEYFVWKQMRNRCNTTTDYHWERWGGRGITICKRWDDFQAFLKDMGPRPSPKHQIDRQDNDLGYWCGKPECPECGPAGRKPNCRWVTAKEQARNKRNNVRVEVDGTSYTLADLADEYGIRYGCLASRLRKGWDIKRALTEPIVMGKNRHGSP